MTMMSLLLLTRLSLSVGIALDEDVTCLLQKSPAHLASHAAVHASVMPAAAMFTAQSSDVAQSGSGHLEESHRTRHRDREGTDGVAQSLAFSVLPSTAMAQRQDAALDPRSMKGFTLVSICIALLGILACIFVFYKINTLEYKDPTASPTDPPPLSPLLVVNPPHPVSFFVNRRELERITADNASGQLGITSDKGVTVLQVNKSLDYFSISPETQSICPARGLVIQSYDPARGWLDRALVWPVLPQPLGYRKFYIKDTGSGTWHGTRLREGTWSAEEYGTLEIPLNSSLAYLVRRGQKVMTIAKDGERVEILATSSGSRLAFASLEDDQSGQPQYKIAVQREADPLLIVAVLLGFMVLGDADDPGTRPGPSAYSVPATNEAYWSSPSSFISGQPLPAAASSTAQPDTLDVTLQATEPTVS